MKKAVEPAGFPSGQERGYCFAGEKAVDKPCSPVRKRQLFWRLVREELTLQDATGYVALAVSAGCLAKYKGKGRGRQGFPCLPSLLRQKYASPVPVCACHSCLDFARAWNGAGSGGWFLLWVCCQPRTREGCDTYSQKLAHKKLSFQSTHP